MNNKKITTMSLVALMAVSFSPAVIADSYDDTYWTTSDGKALKDSSGKCWHAAGGKSQIDGCGTPPAPEPVKEAAPAPVVKPAPAPAPAPAPKPQTFVLNLNEADGANFAFDSAKLSDKSKAELDQLSNKVRASRVTPSAISIVGHTDSIGKTSYNQKLSVQRANSVAGYLAAKGMNKGVMRVSGMGETKPVASNKTKAGRAQNRRVDIRITGSRTVTK